MSLYDMPQSAFDALNEDYLATPEDRVVCDTCGHWTDRYCIVQMGDGLHQFCCPKCYERAVRTGHRSRESGEEIEWNR